MVYRMKKAFYRELLSSCGSKEKVIQYINSSFLVWGTVTEIVTY